jgi:heterogeneous nuclear ribonucleoprotein F/H
MAPPIQALNTKPGNSDAQHLGAPVGFPATGGHGGGAGRGMMPGTQQAKRSGGGIQVGEHTGFLRMRGLPFTATREDISKFFEAYNPILESIVLTYRSDGRATGESYVAFESPEDSQRAMDLHRKSMGNRYIELFLSNKEEHGRALVRFSGR